MYQQQTNQWTTSMHNSVFYGFWSTWSFGHSGTCVAWWLWASALLSRRCKNTQGKHTLNKNKLKNQSRFWCCCVTVWVRLSWSATVSQGEAESSSSRIQSFEFMAVRVHSQGEINMIIKAVLTLKWCNIWSKNKRGKKPQHKPLLG